MAKNKMLAIEITDSHELALTERPVPIPENGEVLIKVHYAGVNRPDILQRIGAYPPPSGASDIPGLEISGTIVGLGTGTDRYSIDEPVCALVTGGGYAQYCVAPQGQVLPIPSGYSMREAASLPETFFTIWTNLVERGRLRAGERLLIHGGTSGIGVAAIQLAVSMGVRVFATARTTEKCAYCCKLGAELAINYREESFVERIKSATHGEGVDVILDMVGGDYVQDNIKCLRSEGRLVQIAFMEGATTTLNLMPIMLKRLTLTGSTLRAQSVASKTRIAGAIEKSVWPLLASRVIKPIIDKEVDLKDAGVAHAHMESSQHIGKIVLCCHS